MRYLTLLCLILFISSCEEAEIDHLYQSETISFKVTGEFKPGDWMEIDGVKFSHIMYSTTLEESEEQNIFSISSKQVRLPASRQIIINPDHGMRENYLVDDLEMLVFIARYLNLVKMDGKNIISTHDLPYRFDSGATFFLGKKLVLSKSDGSLISIRHSTGYPVNFNNVP